MSQCELCYKLLPGAARLLPCLHRCHHSCAEHMQRFLGARNPCRCHESRKQLSATELALHEAGVAFILEKLTSSKQQLLELSSTSPAAERKGELLKMIEQREKRRVSRS